MLPWYANEIIIDGHESVLVKLLQEVLDEQGKPNLEFILPQPVLADAAARYSWRIEQWGTARFDHDSWRVERREIGHAHLRGLSQSTPPTKIVETLAQSHPELRIWFLTSGVVGPPRVRIVGLVGLKAVVER